MVIYLVYFMPMVDKRTMVMEVFNECTIVCLLYHLMCFSDFVPDAEIRSKLGLSYIALALFNILVHLCLISRDTLLKLKSKICKKCIEKRLVERAKLQRIERIR